MSKAHVLEDASNLNTLSRIHKKPLIFFFKYHLLDREALTEIFNMSDLDNDGLLSREEFSLYNLRVSGEEVNDEEWEVVEGQ